MSIKAKAAESSKQSILSCTELLPLYSFQFMILEDTSYRIFTRRAGGAPYNLLLILLESFFLHSRCRMRHPIFQSRVLMACFLSSVIILFLIFMFLRFRLVEHFEAALSFEGDTSSSITCASYVENKKEIARYLLILGFQGEDSYMRC